MCGFAGQFNISNDTAVDQSALKAMATALVHRGPDDAGEYFDGPVGLVFRRLSIIDLTAAGHQPMFSHDKRYVVVFNGEIYNFQEIRKTLEQQGHQFVSRSDTEVILASYATYGVDCVSHFRGQFALAIWDTRERALFMARDRLGMKPLFYYFDGAHIIFASELQALLKHPGVPRKIRYQAIDQYLALQYIPAPQTIYEGITKLEPAHYALIDERGMTTKRYWDLEYRTKHTLSIPEWSERIITTLRESVRLRMISDVPLGAFLSGGIDSSAIVALMSQLSNKPINTFSIGFNNQQYNELPRARLTAERYGTNHHEIVVEPNAMEVLPELVRHYGEPFADSSALPSYYVSRETRKHVTVALNGDGGDENFLGYPWYSVQAIARQYDYLPAVVREKLFRPLLKRMRSSRTTFNRRLQIFLDTHEHAPAKRYPHYITSSYFNGAERNNLYTASFQSQLVATNPLAYISDWYEAAQADDVLDQATYADVHSYLPDDLLVKMDIASMMNSLEARSPFLDHIFMELTSSIPTSLKMKRHSKKWILKQALKNLVPDEILSGKKHGFMVPLGDWFRNELRDYAHEVLLDRQALGRGYFEKQAIIDLLDEHAAGAVDHGSRIWALLFLELWHQEFKV